MFTTQNHPWAGTPIPEAPIDEPEAMDEGEDDDGEEGSDEDMPDLQTVKDPEPTRFPEPCPRLDYHRQECLMKTQPQAVPKLDIRIDPRILKGIGIEKQKSETLMAYLTVSPFLPMHVHGSPCMSMLLCASAEEKDTIPVWRKRTLPWQASVWELSMIRLSCIQGFLPPNMDEIQDAHNDFLWQVSYNEKQVFKRCGQLWDAYDAKELDRQAVLARFIRILEINSLSYIRQNEIFVWRCLLKKHGVPMEAILTPSTNQPVTWTPEFHKHVCDYFESKLMGWNAEFKLDNPQHTFDTFITLDGENENPKKTPKIQVYKNYLTAALTWEYFVHVVKIGARMHV